MKSKKLVKLISIISAVGIIGSFSVSGASAAIVDDPFSVSSSFDEPEVQIAASKYSNLPSKYNSADLGYVTDIRDQKFEDCWAHAGIGTFESKLLKEGFNIGNMSVDWANVWATTKLNGTGWQRNYMSAGYANIFPGYLASWNGGILENDADPVDFSKDVYGDMAPANLARYGATSIRYLSKSDPDQIKKSIMDNGGVSTSYAYINSCSRKNLSYYMPESYSGNYEGHSVEIVGWDDDYPKRNFGEYKNIKPQNNGAWLARNSWGNYNSLGGYFWISYEDKYIFSVDFEPSFTVQDVVEITDDMQLKQNEDSGATYEFSYVITDDTTYINKFDFSDGYNVIDKVIFETKCLGAEYEIYYVPVENEVPDNDENLWIKLGSGQVDYTGYICADFDDFIAPEGEGAIGVRIDASNLNYGISSNDDAYAVSTIGVSEWLALSEDGSYIFINESKQGDCYIKYSDKTMELLDWYKTNLEDDLGATFVIKAVTKTDNSSYMLGDVNLDGQITIDDVTLVQKYLANLTDLSKQSQKNADVDKNEHINVDDATGIQKYMAGLYEW